MKLAFLDGSWNTFSCTLSHLAFWRKCCYFDWRYSVAPPTGHSNTMYNALKVEPWTVWKYYETQQERSRAPDKHWLFCASSIHTLSQVVWNRMRCFLSSEQTLVGKIAPLHRREWNLVPYLCFYTLHGLCVHSLGFLEVHSCQRLLGQLMFPFEKQYFEMIWLQPGVFRIPVNSPCHLLFIFYLF